MRNTSSSLAVLLIGQTPMVSSVCRAKIYPPHLLPCWHSDLLVGCRERDVDRGIAIDLCIFSACLLH